MSKSALASNLFVQRFSIKFFLHVAHGTGMDTLSQGRQKVVVSYCAKHDNPTPSGRDKE
jgi:hypothetical protein